MSTPHPEQNCSDPRQHTQPAESKMSAFSVPFPVDPVLFILICITVALLVNYLRNLYSLFDNLDIPGPKPIWVFGNIQEFRDRNPLDVFKEWRKKYGNIFGFFEGFRPSIVINDPEMAKQVLVSHFDKFHVRPSYNPFVYYPDERSLLNTNGEDWKNQRQVVASAFNAASMKHMVEKIGVIGDRLKARLASYSTECPEGFDISKVVDRYTLDAFSYSAFDYDADSLNTEDAVLYRFMTEFNKSASADNPLAGLCRVYPSLVPVLKVFDYKFRNVHAEHMKEIRKQVAIQKEKVKNADYDVRDSLISQLIRGEYPERDECGNVVGKRQLTDEELAGHLNSLIGGGLGTTNAALSFVLYQLSVNPDIQEKAYEYIMERCGNDLPSSSDLQNMDYLDHIIRESLRLLPCAPGVARTCTEDCEINKIKFKKGMLIRVMGFCLYSDPTIFPNPEKFDPDRFLPSECESRHRFTFLPFGKGARMCPGEKIGMIELKVAMVKILQEFRIERCSKTVEPLPLALRPMLCPRDGVFVKLVRRV